MALDKELYRKVYAAHRQWSEEKLLYQIRHESALSSREAWERYAALVEFCWRIAPESGDWERKQKLIALAQYYERVQKLEAWRRARAKAA
ncbi:MAG TPA: hypothetical protein VI793_18490 [Anaerolineales bacterium]|nr:hypothetical protein [Anaerolineales bacterium]